MQTLNARSLHSTDHRFAMIFSGRDDRELGAGWQSWVDRKRGAVWAAVKGQNPHPNVAETRVRIRSAYFGDVRMGHPAPSNIPTLNFAKNAKFRMGHSLGPTTSPGSEPPRSEAPSFCAAAPVRDGSQHPKCCLPQRRQTASTHRRRGLAILRLPRATDSRPR